MIQRDSLKSFGEGWLGISAGSGLFLWVLGVISPGRRGLISRDSQTDIAAEALGIAERIGEIQRDRSIWCRGPRYPECSERRAVYAKFPAPHCCGCWNNDAWLAELRFILGCPHFVSADGLFAAARFINSP